MAEYIDREAVLLHLNDIWLSATPTDTMYDDDRQLAMVRCMGLNDAMDVVKEAPAADVRPVIFCRDCEYFSEVMYGGTQFEYGFCDRWADGTRMNHDDFCSRGKKREES